MIYATTFTNGIPVRYLRITSDRFSHLGIGMTRTRESGHTCNLNWTTKDKTVTEYRSCIFVGPSMVFSFRLETRPRGYTT